jgi:hypothetical protein
METPNAPDPQASSDPHAPITCPGCSLTVAPGSRTFQRIDGTWHEPCFSDRIAGRQPGVTRAGLQEALDDVMGTEPPADPATATLRVSLITALGEALR